MTKIVAYFQLDVPVDGGMGPTTKISSDATEEGWPDVTYLEYQLETWTGCHIITTYPCYLVTDKVIDILRENAFTGWRVDDAVIVTKSNAFVCEPDDTLQIPGFYRFHVSGRISKLSKSVTVGRFKEQILTDSNCDFLLGPKAELLVSQRVINSIDLDLLMQTAIRSFPIALKK